VRGLIYVVPAAEWFYKGCNSSDHFRQSAHIGYGSETGLPLPEKIWEDECNISPVRRRNLARKQEGSSVSIDTVGV